MTTDENVSEVLLNAADLIDRYGFAHGQYESDSGELCTVGAIKRAVWGSHAFCEWHQDKDRYEKEALEVAAKQKLVNFIHPKNPTKSVVFWSDRLPYKTPALRERSAKTVAKRMRQAARVTIEINE